MTMLVMLAVFLARSVPLVVGGVAVCNATPMDGGYYTARHCMTNVRGVYSVDATRDLAHIPGPRWAQPLRLPEESEAGELRAHNRTVRAVFAGWQTVIEHPDHYEVADSGDQTVMVWCRYGGSSARPGDSGSGIYLGDGALAGIVVSGQMPQSLRPLRFTLDSWCGTQQRIFAVAVP